ncbi:hypothetical protein [Arthrobacter sp. H14]|uniref:hypothetical protein n=1 Tax=Arthrobacter sp. H14 TaxID=1312959 RepID=UPI00047B14FA|nr:hypothetical protein [Arthrobacter sp. H14]
MKNTNERSNTVQHNPKSSKIDALENVVFAGTGHTQAAVPPESGSTAPEPAVLGLFHDPLDPVNSRSLPTSTAHITARGYQL